MRQAGLTRADGQMRQPRRARPHQHAHGAVLALYERYYERLRVKAVHVARHGRVQRPGSSGLRGCARQRRLLLLRLCCISRCSPAVGAACASRLWQRQVHDERAVYDLWIEMDLQVGRGGPGGKLCIHCTAAAIPQGAVVWHGSCNDGLLPRPPKTSSAPSRTAAAAGAVGRSSLRAQPAGGRGVQPAGCINTEAGRPRWASWVHASRRA